VYPGALLLLSGILFLITGQRAMNIVLPPFALGVLWIWIGMGGSYQLSARKQFAGCPGLGVFLTLITQSGASSFAPLVLAKDGK
jgi:hypothetical protein